VNNLKLVIISVAICFVLPSCKKNYNCTCTTSTLKTTYTGYIGTNGGFVTTSTSTTTVVTYSVITINHSTRDNAIEVCDSSDFKSGQSTTNCVLN